MAPGCYDGLSALLDRAGRVLGGLSVGRRHRLYPLRPLRRRPGHHDRGGRDARGRDRPRRHPGHRRRRHRLRQRAQRPAHRPHLRARGRGRDPARGPVDAQALRASRRQDAGRCGGDGRQAPRGARRAAERRYAADRAHRRRRGRGPRSRARPGRALCRGGRRHPVRRGAAARTPSSRRSPKRFGGRIPLLANMVEGGKTPIHPAAELQTMGYSVVIFAAGLARAFAHHGAGLSGEPQARRLDPALCRTGCSISTGSTPSSAPTRCSTQGRRYDADAHGGNGKSEAKR